MWKWETSQLRPRGLGRKNSIFQAVLIGRGQYMGSSWDWGVILQRLGRRRRVNRSYFWGQDWNWQLQQDFFLNKFSDPSPLPKVPPVWYICSPSLLLCPTVYSLSRYSAYYPLDENPGRAKITSWNSDISLPEHSLTPLLKHHFSVAKVIDFELGEFVKKI